MGKLTPRDGFVKETDIKTQRGTARYRVDKTGKYNVDNPAHIKALKSQGFSESNLSVYTTGDSDRGYTCSACGFASWFVKCSRCGHEAEVIRTDGD
jgi:hypothetical protein